MRTDPGQPPGHLFPMKCGRTHKTSERLGHPMAHAWSRERLLCRADSVALSCATLSRRASSIFPTRQLIRPAGDELSNLLRTDLGQASTAGRPQPRSPQISLRKARDSVQVQTVPPLLISERVENASLNCLSVVPRLGVVGGGPRRRPADPGNITRVPQRSGREGCRLPP